MSDVNIALLEMGKCIDRVMRGQAAVFNFSADKGRAFSVMLSNIDMNDEADRDMAELIQRDGTDDVTVPCRYLKEISHRFFTDSHVNTIVDLLRIDPNTIPRYYYLNNKLFITCGEVLFMLSSGRIVDSIPGRLQ